MTHKTESQDAFRRLCKTLKPQESLKTLDGTVIRNVGRYECRVLIETPKPKDTPTD